MHLYRGSFQLFFDPSNLCLKMFSISWYYIAAFVLQNKNNHLQLFLSPVYFLYLHFVCYSPAHPIWLQRFIIPKDSCISGSLFFDASRVLTWISSAKDEISISDTVSITKFVGISHLSLVAALKDSSNAGCLSSTHAKVLKVLNLLMFLVQKTRVFTVAPCFMLQFQ